MFYCQCSAILLPPSSDLQKSRTLANHHIQIPKERTVEGYLIFKTQIQNVWMMFNSFVYIAEVAQRLKPPPNSPPVVGSWLP